SEVEEIMLARADIQASAVYKFFPANAENERLLILNPDGRSLVSEFEFGRQSKPPHICLADYIAPRKSGKTDYVGMFATTVGPGVRALADEWKAKGDYLRSHVLQVLALES